jgi:succinyl-diaminopimelate desuccinylase
MSRHALAERLADALTALCATASVTGHEQALADQIWTWMGQLETKGRRSRRGNAIIFGEPHPTRPTVALVGHIDTVPPPGSGFVAPRRDGNDIVGLGASDMKGGLAVMQVLLEDLIDQDTPISPMLVFYDQEEGAFAANGLEPLLASHDELRRVDLAIVLEPTDNTLQLGCVGSMQAKVTFRGQAAHAARPWQGDNAIHRAGPLLVHLLGQIYEEVEVAGLVFRQAISATLAQGGRAKNVVPDRFELNVNVRFPPGDNAIQHAQAELTRLAQGADIEIMDVAPPGPVPEHNPLLHHWRSLCNLKVEPKQAWTDVARLANYGIDAVNYGPGATAQAHQAGERIAIDALVENYEQLRRLFDTPLDDSEKATEI